MSGTRPSYPWSEGDALYADELNAAIANAGSGGGAFLPLAGGTLDPGPLNINSYAPLQTKGSTILRTGNVTTQFSLKMGSLFLGVDAGANYPLSTDTLFGSVGIGPGALQSLNTLNAENTAVGAWAAQFVTNATGVTAIGMHANGHDNSNGNTALGNDAIRDAITGGNVTAVGAGAVSHGNPTNVVGIGLQTLQGNASAFFLSGTITAGNSITINATSAVAGLTGLPFSTVVPIVGGDTLATVANRIQTAINGSNITGPGNLMQAFVATQPGGNPVVWLVYPGNTTLGWAITWTMTPSGGATIAVAVKTGSKPSDTVAIGMQALAGPAMTDVTGTVAVGHQAGVNIQTTDGTTLIGSASGSSTTTGTRMTYLGARAGQNATTASFSTVIGYATGANTFATGSGVLLIGSGANGVDTPAPGTGNYLNIENIFTCAGTNNGTESLAAIAGYLNVGNQVWVKASTGLTATGTTQGTALALTGQIARVTSAAAGTGVVLPIGNVGLVYTLFNDGANAIKVYGNAAGGATVDGIANATGVTLGAGKRCQYITVANNVWVSAQLGAVSA